MGLVSMMEKRAGISDADDRWYMPFAPPVSSGVEVNEDTALTLSAVWCAVGILSSAMGSLPLKLYRRKGSAGKEPARDHPAYRIVYRRPNAWQSAFEFREMKQGHLGLRGNAYAQIIRDRMNRVRDLIPLHPGRTSPVVENDRLRYKFLELDGKERTFEQEEILHLRGLSSNGLTGYSPITLARESIGLGMAAQKHGAHFFGNYASPGGVLQTEGNLTKEQRSAVRESWISSQGGENRLKPAVLEGGLSWQVVGFSNHDAEWLGSMTHSINDVARWFNLPPHKLKELSRATFSNIEHQNLEFVVDSIRPWAERWEQRYDLSLLTEEEQEEYFFKFSLEALLRGDTAARAAFYQALFNMAALSPNDIRGLEDMNPVPGGDQRFVQLNLIPLERAGDVFDATGGGSSAEGGEEDDGEGEEDGQGEETEEEARRLREKRARQTRSVQTRYKYRTAYEPIFREAGTRVVGREVNGITRIITAEREGDDEGGRSVRDLNRETLKAKLRTFFQEHKTFVRDAFLSLLTAYQELIVAAAAEEIDEEWEADDVAQRFVQDYAEAMAARHVRSSERQLVKIMDTTDAEELEDALRGRLDEWREKRPGKIGFREAVQAGGAFAVMVYRQFNRDAVWVTSGETCDLCLMMDGRVVRAGENFLNAGDTVEPEDSETEPLTVRSGVAHPQLHGGCDCSVAAA